MLQWPHAGYQVLHQPIAHTEYTLQDKIIMKIKNYQFIEIACCGLFQQGEKYIDTAGMLGDARYGD